MKCYIKVQMNSLDSGQHRACDHSSVFLSFVIAQLV
jgi:hypothetical protein